MNIIDCKCINICGLGFQTEGLMEFCKNENIAVNCVVVERFTYSPLECYKIPSKRVAVRNSFSEVDMLMDTCLCSVPVKRIDTLTDDDMAYPFVILENNEDSIRIYNILKNKSRVKLLFLTKDMLSAIFNITYSNSDIIGELWKTNQYLYSEIQRLKHCVRRQLEPTIFDFHFEFHIVEHCNLNCRGCTHFAPLAKEEFLSIEEFEHDISRLSYLTQKQARFINLLGGEPLLHPNINNFLVVAREYFPSSDIKLVTNGILLEKKEAAFWNTCKKNNIIIGVTEYPIELDYGKLISLIREHDIQFESFSGGEFARNEMWKLSLDKNNLSRPIDNFINCPRANACVFVKHGKIYNCATMANIEHFNSYFNCSYQLLPDDGLNFHETDNVNDIFSFCLNQSHFAGFAILQKESTVCHGNTHKE